MNVTIRKLQVHDKQQLDALLKDVEGHLAQPEFWLPVQQEAYDHFFDSAWTYFAGVFDDGKLIGAAALFFNEFEWGQSKKLLNLTTNSIAEFGRAMVQHNFRGKGVMGALSAHLLECARSLNIEYMVATVHPNNIASQKVLQKMGLEKQAECVKECGYARSVYAMKL